MANPLTIVVATTNEHKLVEMRQILTGVNLITAADAGFHDEIDETGKTFAENALLKARTVCRATGLAALGDDSGLCVDALDGAPGIYSARYSGKGVPANRQLLLQNLHGVTDRKAHFTCALALVFPDGREFSVLGQTFGQILTAEQGRTDFGYDCLFRSDDLGKSFGEATAKEKNAVSHRGRALHNLMAELKTAGILK